MVIFSSKYAPHPMNSSAPENQPAHAANVQDFFPMLRALPPETRHFDSADFPKLKATQFAGLSSEGWQVFDSMDVAAIYAREWVSLDLAGEYKIYDARLELVKTVRNGQPRGDLYAAWQASQPRPWWKFWK
jgi:hypothetical protein